MDLHEMRRKDREKTEQDGYDILREVSYGIMSTVSVDGTPYGVPINFVLSENKIYFHCAHNVGHKLENLLNNPNVCFTAVSKAVVVPKEFASDYRSVVVFGSAEEVTGNEKIKGLMLLVEKYSPDFRAEGIKYIEASADATSVFAITISHITAKER